MTTGYVSKHDRVKPIVAKIQELGERRQKLMALKDPYPEDVAEERTISIIMGRLSGAMTSMMCEHDTTYLGCDGIKDKLSCKKCRRKFYIPCPMPTKSLKEIKTRKDYAEK